MMQTRQSRAYMHGLFLQKHSHDQRMRRVYSMTTPLYCATQSMTTTFLMSDGSCQHLGNKSYWRGVMANASKLARIKSSRVLCARRAPRKRQASRLELVGYSRCEATSLSSRRRDVPGKCRIFCRQFPHHQLISSCFRPFPEQNIVMSEQQVAANGISDGN